MKGVLDMNESLWARAAIEQNRRWLSAYVLTLTGDLNEYEDLVQETLRIAYEKRDSFKPGTNFSAWLRTIARNVCRRYMDERKRVSLMNPEDAETRLGQLVDESQQRLLAFEETRNQYLKECLEELNRKSYRLIMMRYGQGLSLNQIATRTRRKLSAVTVAIFRIRSILADCIRRKESNQLHLIKRVTA